MKHTNCFTKGNITVYSFKTPKYSVEKHINSQDNLIKCLKKRRRCCTKPFQEVTMTQIISEQEFDELQVHALPTFKEIMESK